MMVIAEYLRSCGHRYLSCCSESWMKMEILKEQFGAGGVELGRERFLSKSLLGEAPHHPTKRRRVAAETILFSACTSPWTNAHTSIEEKCDKHFFVMFVPYFLLCFRGFHLLLRSPPTCQIKRSAYFVSIFGTLFLNEEPRYASREMA